MFNAFIWFSEKLKTRISGKKRMKGRVWRALLFKRLKLRLLDFTEINVFVIIIKKKKLWVWLTAMIDAKNKLFSPNVKCYFLNQWNFDTFCSSVAVSKVVVFSVQWTLSSNEKWYFNV